MMELYGVKIRVDPTLSPGSWHFDSPEMRELSMIILKLDTFMKSYRMRLDSIDIGADK